MSSSMNTEPHEEDEVVDSKTSSYFLSRDYSRAIEALKQLLEGQNSENREEDNGVRLLVLNNISVVFGQAEKYKTALLGFTYILNKVGTAGSPEWVAKVKHNLGLLLMQNNAHSEAVEIFKQLLLSTGGDKPVLWFYMAQCLVYGALEKGPPQAFSAGKSRMELYLNHTSSRMFELDISHASSALQCVVNCQKMLSEMDPHHYGMLLHDFMVAYLTYLYTVAGQGHEVIHLAGQAEVAMSPLCFYIANYAAESFMKLGRYEHAGSALYSALSFLEKNPQKAVAMLDIKNNSDAQAVLQRQFAVLNVNLAYIQSKANNYERANAHALSAVESGRPCLDSSLSCIFNNLMLGETNQALSLLRDFRWSV